jgi:hypothetical protein
LFFFWFAKNRHFKKGSKLSGQVTPFLLIILVVLLIAAVATINIGKTSIDKTCSANGADAGALATASTWAGAFNGLSETNLNLGFYFDDTASGYKDAYNEASIRIEAAILLVLAAQTNMISSAALTVVPPIIGEVWINGLAASILNGITVTLLFFASQNVSAFHTSAIKMKEYTDAFHQQQGQRFCNAVDSMQTSYNNSRKTGLNYAFSNSCISDKLPPDQSGPFSVFLAKMQPYVNKTRVAYSWTDDFNQGHVVAATLDLPIIEDYRIQPTNKGYANISDLLDQMINRSNLIHTALVALAGSVLAFGPIPVFVLSVTVWLLTLLCAAWPPSCPALFFAAGSMYALYGFMQTAVVAALVIIAAIATVPGQILILSLRNLNDQAFLGWQARGLPNTDFPRGKVCVDGQPNDALKDVMIVKINEVILPDNNWTTTCCVEQIHPANDTGLLPAPYPYTNVKSCGTAKFDGGNVGTFNMDIDPFNYDASVTEYVPTKKYDPGITAAN